MTKSQSLLLKKKNKPEQGAPLNQSFHSPEASGSWTTQDDAWAFTADAKRNYESYVGVPAPTYLSEDPWFSSPTLSKKQMTVKEAHEQAVADQQILDESKSKESADIHQKLYKMATKNWNTVAESQYQGGSENFQSGPGGWNSGTGMGQFKS